MPNFSSLRLIVFEKIPPGGGGGSPVLSHLVFPGGILDYFRTKVEQNSLSVIISDLKISDLIISSKLNDYIDDVTR